LFALISCSENKNETAADDNLTNEIANAKLSVFSELFFVGNYSGNPSIYIFISDSKKVNVFWNKNDEQVIDLLVSPDRKAAYFLTKQKQKLKSSQPAIEQGRLYHIDFETKKVESVAKFEEGIQLISFWNDNDRFTVVINSVDKTIASYINKNIQVYNRFGKLLSDNSEIFDLTIDGYPLTKLPALKYTSPNQLFTVVQKNDSIQIKRNKIIKNIPTRFVNKDLTQIEWAENNKLVILKMKPKSISKQQTAGYNNFLLVIFDIKKEKTLKIFDDDGYKNFVLIGDFLIFDSGFGKDSNVIIYKLNPLEEVNTIKINGGCGLRNIPNG
jgi:hypothetical protein